jgi:organic radical activating enzyme
MKKELPPELASKKILLCKEEPFFVSPEGEGLWTGRLCSWMRTSTCNLSCAWTNSDGTVTLCDTPYTSHKPSRYAVTLQEAYDTLMEANTSYVSISGGEPSSQKIVVDLINFIEDSGKKVKVETNGTQFFESKATLISMSPKLKSSSSGLRTMSDPNYHKQDTNGFLNTTDFDLQARHYTRLNERHESLRYNLDSIKRFMEYYKERVVFKFVANSEDDMEEILENYVKPLSIPANQVWLMAQGNLARRHSGS